MSYRLLSQQLFWKMQSPELWRRLSVCMSMSQWLLSFCWWVFSTCENYYSLPTTKYLYIVNYFTKHTSLIQLLVSCKIWTLDYVLYFQRLNRIQFPNLSQAQQVKLLMDALHLFQLMLHRTQRFLTRPKLKIQWILIKKKIPQWNICQQILTCFKKVS